MTIKLPFILFLLALPLHALAYEASIQGHCTAKVQSKGTKLVKTCIEEETEALRKLSEIRKQPHPIIQGVLDECLRKWGDTSFRMVHSCTEKALNSVADVLR